MDRFTLVLCLCCLPCLAVASEDERARIAAERRAQIAAFDAQERDCASRFRVTACIDEVRARRREALAPLRQQVLRLDENDRLRRAQERRAAIAAKQAAAAAPPPPSAAPQARLRKPLRPASTPAHEPAPNKAALQGQPARAIEAQQRRREALRRQQEAQATQARIEQRQAQRKGAGRKSDPLPLPDAASAAGR